MNRVKSRRAMWGAAAEIGVGNAEEAHPTGGEK
jgi:hypothetical protein